MAEPRIEAARPSQGLGRLLVLAASAAVGIIGLRLAMPALASWYPGLARPVIALPAPAVLPVWLAVLALAAAAAWIAIQAQAEPRALNRAMRAFWIQLALSLGWVLIFFGARDPGWAFCEALILLAALIVALLRFATLDRRAGLLMLPGLAWSAHAAITCFLIWQLNLKP